MFGVRKMEKSYGADQKLEKHILPFWFLFVKRSDKLSKIMKCVWVLEKSECNFSDPEVIETLFVEITVPQEKNIIVGSVYRPPN